MNLREKILRGGFYLTARQGLGIVIGLAGVVVLTRLIGPANYGLYAGAVAIVTLLTDVSGAGINVYLVRRQDDPAENVFHQAWSLLLLNGAAFVGIAGLASLLLSRGVVDPHYAQVFVVMMLTLPLTVLSKAPVSRLERALDYKKVAGVELAGQIGYYALALPLAWQGFGVWAPIMGYALAQFWRLGASCALARYRPRWYWSPELAREMRRYGLSVAASNWVFRLRTLVNPIIIGYFLGPEGVGYVALAIRIVEVLSFVKKATWQLSVAAFARIQGDLPRLSRAFQEAMGLQMLGLGPFFAGFALVSLWLIPLLYGERWMPVLTVLPFIALGYMFNAVFNMHSSVLYVMRRNRDVVAFSSLHVALFAGAAVLLVDRLGLVGYGLAEVVALGSYIIIHRRMARVFDFDYVKVRPWLLASAPPLFFPFLGFPWGILLCVPAVAALAFDRSAHAQLREYASYAMRNYGRRFRKKGTTSRNLGREADESQANA